MSLYGLFRSSRMKESCREHKTFIWLTDGLGHIIKHQCIFLKIFSCCQRWNRNMGHSILLQLRQYKWKSASISMKTWNVLWYKNRMMVKLIKFAKFKLRNLRSIYLEPIYDYKIIWIYHDEPNNYLRIRKTLLKHVRYNQCFLNEA